MKVFVGPDRLFDWGDNKSMQQILRITHLCFRIYPFAFAYIGYLTKPRELGLFYYLLIAAVKDMNSYH